MARGHARLFARTTTPASARRGELLVFARPFSALDLDLLTLQPRLLEQLPDPSLASPRVGQLLGQLIPALVPIQLIFTTVGLDRLPDDPLSLAAQARLK